MNKVKNINQNGIAVRRKERVIMIPFERQQKILEALKKDTLLYTEELAKILPEASESTLRRDLKTLEAAGQITLIRGGARFLGQEVPAQKQNPVPPVQGSISHPDVQPGVLTAGTVEEDSPVLSRAGKYTDEKDRIARCAAALVHDGDAIYLDSGSTVLQMVQYLKGKHKITIVTTNALISSELARAGISDSDITCIIIGGKLLISTGSIVGSETNQALRGYFFNKAFLGISGISDTAGFNTVDSRESEKKQVVFQNSEVTYILADSSKSGVKRLCKTLPLGEATLITEKETDLIRNAGNFIIAE